MARMKIQLPDYWQFTTEVTIRVTDLNYGNHLANQQFLAYAQEARIRYFAEFDFDELNFGGVSLIQADAAITFKGEGHLGDIIKIELTAVQEGNSSFNIYYKFTNGTKNKTMAHIRTALLCYDYEKGKPTGFTPAVLNSKIFST